MQILISDNTLSHPASEYAKATAEAISPFDDGLMGDRLADAERMRAHFRSILEPLHRANQERDAEPIDNMAAQAAKEIITASRGTPWQAHYAKPEVRIIVTGIIVNHMQTSRALAEEQYKVDHNSNEDS